MKYLVVLCDGMADTPVAELGGKTPMEVAHKENMDALVQESIVGMAKTVPDGMKPGSDVANLSALGYDPASCYTGRSPLEALIPEKNTSIPEANDGTKIWESKHSPHQSK